jgi:DNA-binding response OmpR family regulator
MSQHLTSRLTGFDSSRSTIRILVVDDEPCVRNLVSAVLIHAGYDVTAACDAAQAIDLCGTRSFDLLLSDVAMPGLDGHALVQWMAGNRPTTCTAFMTADPTGHQFGYSSPCKILPKPFLPKDLVAFVQAVLHQ